MGRMYQCGGGEVTRATLIGTGLNFRNVMIPFLRMPFVHYVHYVRTVYIVLHTARNMWYPSTHAGIVYVATMSRSRLANVR